MAAEACRNALVDAGLDSDDVDGIADFGVMDSSPGLAVAHALGVDDVAWCLDQFGGGNVASAVVANAAHAVRNGMCEVVLVYRSLNGRSGHRFGQAMDRLDVGGEAQFAAPHGYLVPPQWMAMWARRHQYVYRSTCEDLGRIAITQRAHAVPNPHAVGRHPLTMDDYLAARWINEPLRLFDCTFEVDGACALVLTTMDRARDLPHTPVRLLAAAEAHGSGGSWDQWADLTTMYSARTAPRLWSRTGLGASDVDVACMYDCFTYTVMATMEDFGFCGKGDVGAFFAEGRATYGGDVVVNPHGGLLSEGYIHGLNHHFEAVQQLRHEAGERQVVGAEVALVTAGAGPYGGALVYVREAA
jgi:acetyl-CoA acetyltransferase